VDGHDRGVTPASLENLRRGDHLVTFVRLGYRRANRTIVMGRRFDELAELQLGLALQPGVYTYLYDEMAPLVSPQKVTLTDGDIKKLSEAAATLEVKQLLIIQLDTGNSYTDGFIRTLHYKGPTSPIKRHEIAFDFEADGLWGLGAEVVREHFDINTADLPVVEELSPIYFKLTAPPITQHDDYDNEEEE